MMLLVLMMAAGVDNDENPLQSLRHGAVLRLGSCESLIILLLIAIPQIILFPLLMTL